MNAIFQTYRTIVLSPLTRQMSNCISWRLFQGATIDLDGGKNFGIELVVSTFVMS